MARISLLFSLAFALAVAFASAHDAPSASATGSGSVRTRASSKYTSPCTVGQLKTLPYAEILKLLDMKAKSAPMTAEFQGMFTMCKDYTSFLASFSKRSDFEVAFRGAEPMWKAKFAAMNQAVMLAQSSFGAGGKASVELKKSYSGMIQGFAELPSVIAQISSRHQFKAAAKLTGAEKKQFSAVFGNLKKSISGYMNAAFEIAAKKQITSGGSFGGKFGGQFGGKFVGDFVGGFPGMGGKAQVGGSSKVEFHGKKKKKAHH